MTLGQRLRAAWGTLFNTKSEFIRSMIIAAQTNEWARRDYGNLVTQGFEANVTVYACVMEIARSVASVPWVLFQKRSNGEREEISQDHPLLQLLRKPNSTTFQTDWTEQAISHLEIDGNVYIVQPERSTELFLLRPDQVQIQANSQDIVQSYEHWVNAQMVRSYTPEEVLHIRFVSPKDSLKGIGPLSVAFRDVQVDNQTLFWNFNLLKNDLRPAGALIISEDADDDQRRRMKEQIEERWSSAANAGRPLLLDSRMEWQQLSVSPKDLDFANGRILQKRDICVAFQVPPELIGDSASKTYANYQEARKSFYMETVLPTIDKFRDGYNAWLTPRFGEGLELDYDKDSIPALQEDALLSFQRLAIADFLTLNEQRQEVGFERFEDPEADVPRYLQNQRSFGAGLGLSEEDEDEELDEQEEEDDEDIEEENVEEEQEEAAGHRFGAFKFFGVDSEEKKRLLFKQVEQGRRTFERASVAALRRYFRVERRMVLKAYGETRQRTEVVPFLGEAVRAHRKDRLIPIYLTMYTRTARHFRNEVLRSLAKAKDLPRLQARIAQVVEVKTRAVTDTTERRLADIFTRGFDAQLSDEEIADQIERLYLSYERKRARTIAENEITEASNLGAVTGATEADAVLEKAWITQRDGNVRRPPKSPYNHVSADGQRAPIEQDGGPGLFRVSGQQLEYPGDTGHGAALGNVMNCRCFLAFDEVG